MGRDDQRGRIDLQDQLQDVFGVQPQNGAAVGGDVAQPTQALGKLLAGRQRGQQHQGMDFAGLTVFLVDAADLAGNDEADGGLVPMSHRFLGGGLPIRRLQGVETRFRRLQADADFGQPAGMGAIAAAQKGKAFIGGPEVQLLQV